MRNMCSKNKINLMCSLDDEGTINCIKKKFSKHNYQKKVFCELLKPIRERYNVYKNIENKFFIQEIIHRDIPDKKETQANFEIFMEFKKEDNKIYVYDLTIKIYFLTKYAFPYNHFSEKALSELNPIIYQFKNKIFKGFQRWFIKENFHFIYKNKLIF